ncbi:MAG: hypothetical protein RSE50_00980 [Myroides sp.]
MSNSTIKQKVGICIDCPSNSKEQPLTAKRCSTHYWNYRASLKPIKIKEIGKSDWKEAKRKEMNAFLVTAKIEKKKQKPIPKRSKKKIVEDLQYSVLRKEFLGKPENRICKINGMPTTEIHHKYCGKDRAKYYLDTSTWLAVNRDSHNFIHDNPKKSRELGYLM